MIVPLSLSSLLRHCLAACPASACSESFIFTMSVTAVVVSVRVGSECTDMPEKVPLCSKCGLVKCRVGFPSCCKKCYESVGRYHNWNCEAAHIRQDVLCVMCELVGAARNYRTCCSPCYSSHGMSTWLLLDFALANMILEIVNF